MRAALFLIPLVLLAACGTPQERCIRQSTAELRRVTQLVAEVRGNLARGYAWQEYETETSRWEICGYDTITKGDKVIRRPRMCLEDYTVTRERPVPIDPVVEKRKLENLLKRQAELSKAAEAQIAACKAAYPEDAQ
ncbi:MAG: hypothetical protein H5U24_02815 [Thioclava marina]|uniref:hypothetical protein n=1 Tax=Thioclava marina TaxID=1915077 RepID=UPI0019B4F728|nr:hypothetical protein [Thioclava marina]MBC7144317.1 hypothetical protein [Thioclava marina]